MLTHLPNFTKEDLNNLNKACGLLSESLKKARAAGKDTGNPLAPLIDEVLADKRQNLIESPLFYQALFLAADSSTESVIDKIHYIKKDLESTDEVK